MLSGVLTRSVCEVVVSGSSGGVTSSVCKGLKAGMTVW